MAALAVAGCAGSGRGAPIRGDEAQRAIAAAFERPLTENIITGPKATTDRIERSFTGGGDQEHLVAVVFTDADGSRALTGGARSKRLSGPQHTEVIQVANVVVLYTRASDVLDRGQAFRRALRSVARG